jgi:hypothetical protein
MLKVRNASVFILRLVLVGIPSMLEFFALLTWLVSLPGSGCNRLRWYMHDKLPKRKLSADEEEAEEKEEEERQDRLHMTLAEFDEKYPPGQPLSWPHDGDEVKHAVVVGPWSVGDDKQE